MRNYEALKYVTSGTNTAGLASAFRGLKRETTGIARMTCCSSVGHQICCYHMLLVMSCSSACLDKFEDRTHDVSLAVTDLQAAAKCQGHGLSFSSCLRQPRDLFNPPQPAGLRVARSLSTRLLYHFHMQGARTSSSHPPHIFSPSPPIRQRAPRAPSPRVRSYLAPATRYKFSSLRQKAHLTRARA